MSDWTDLRTCPTCRALADENAVSCIHCGGPIPQTAGEARQLYAARRRDAQRKATALAVGYGGVMMAIILPFMWIDDAGEVQLFFIQNSLFILVGVLAALLSGSNGLMKSFGRRPTARWTGLGIAGGLVSFAAAWLWVGMFRLLIGDPALPPITLFLFVSVAVMPPLLEEWICRGVLWNAIRPYISERATIFSTAIIFGLLHSLDFTFLFSFPHRFVSGLVFGWLRARSGSIVPGIVAHFVLNLLAISI